MNERLELMNVFGADLQPHQNCGVAHEVNGRFDKVKREGVQRRKK